MGYQRSQMMKERMADNRHRILRAARELISQGGFRQASVSAVAETAGLSTGAIYRYFPSKADLFVEALQAAVDHECEILSRIIEQQHLSHAERLSAAVASFANRALEGPHLAYAFIAEPVDPVVEAHRIECKQQFSDVFKRMLKQGIAAGEFPRQSVDVSAACIVGAFTEALIRPVGPSKKRGVSEKRLVQGIVEFCSRAVSVPLSAASSGSR